MKIKTAVIRLLLVGILLQLTAPAADPLRVFIRGGKKSHGPGAHEHERFLGDWTRLLTERGLKVNGAMAFPTAAQLAETDVLIMYAQEGGEIPEEGRPGLEAFLKRGGGVVVIHTAAVPLNNPGSSAYLKSVIGGSWVWGQTKWLEGPMSLYYVDQTHPITAGAANYDLNDEIYYDLDLDPNIRVLAAAYTPNTPAGRRAQAARGKVTVYDIQPQMWTFERTLAGGEPYRAFVHIPGHLYQNFSLPHFRGLLLRGIAWAGKRPNLDEFLTAAEIESFRYPEGGPSRPETARAKIELHPEFAFSLTAAEPLINKPMNIDWDGEGRLWVAETPEYPDGRYANGPADLVQRWTEGKLNPATGRYERPAHDKISVLTDSDGDGIMDSKRVFYEGLELVTSFVLHEDGVIAAAAPDIWLLQDQDGDGKAEKAEKLYTNLGTRDTHAVINNLRWGFDGWIYATHGYSSSPNVTSGDSSKTFGGINSGVVRFKPDGSAFEQFSSKGGNTWGLQISWDNEVFWTQPTSGDLLMHTLLSERELARARVQGLPSFRVVSKSLDTHPLIPYSELPYVQIDWVGKFTAAAGTVIYDGGAWPRKWDYAYFTTEPTINIVHHQQVQPDGVSFAARREPNRESVEFMAGRDMWFRPIEVRTGPDGAMYVVDFYNQAVIHNDTRGPKHGPRNAAVRPDRDHYYGRIWRIDHKQAQRSPIPNLALASSADRVNALEHPNQHVRMNALRLLVEANATSSAPALKKLLLSSKSSQARVAALWTLARLNQLDPSTIAAAAQDGPAVVQKNLLMAAKSLQKAPGASGTADAAANAFAQTALSLTQSPDARVQLEALKALAEFPVDASTAERLISLYPKLNDPFQRAAFIGIAASAPALFLNAALAAADPAGLEPLAAQLSNRLLDNNDLAAARDFVVRIAAAGPASDAIKQALLTSFGASPKLNALETTPELQSALQRLLRAENPSVAIAALPLAVRWDRQGALKADVQRGIALLESRMTDSTSPEARRIEAAATLLNVREGAPNAVPAVIKLLGTQNSIPLQHRVIDVLGAQSDPEIGKLLAQVLPALPGEIQNASFNLLLKRAVWSSALIDAIENGAIDFNLVGPANAHRLRLHPDAAIAARAKALIEKIRGAEISEKTALVAKFTPIVEQPGNAARGKELFTANCASCHQFAGAGVAVGPALDGMGAHGPSELLGQILDPNRELDFSYAAWSVETKDDEILDGIITRENPSMIALRNAAGEREIPKDRIASRRNTGRSLMPEGFEALGGDGLRDLLAYIAGGENRFRFLDLADAFTADSRKGMYRTLEADNERVRIIKRGVVTAHGVPFRIADPNRHPLGHDVMVLSGGAGRNMFSQGLPRRVSVKVGFPAKALHFLGGIAGWGYPFITEKIPALKIKVVYRGGATEELLAHNSVEFADYNRVIEVPGSKLVTGLTENSQVRFFSKSLTGNQTIESIEFESFGNEVAPTTLAVTAELKGPATAAEAVGAAPAPTAASGSSNAANSDAFVWENGPRVLLVGGGSAHDYPRFFNAADTAILKSAGFSVRYTEDPAITARELKRVSAAVISVNSQGFDTPELRRAVFDFAVAGKGLVILHAGVWLNYNKWPEYNRELIGGVSRAHDRLGEFGVRALKSAHPVMRGVPENFRIIDELYHFNADPAGTPIEVLAETTTSNVTKKEHPAVWIVKHPSARIVGISLGHDGRAHDHPAFQQLLKNAVAWTISKE